MDQFIFAIQCKWKKILWKYVSLKILVNLKTFFSEPVKMISQSNSFLCSWAICVIAENWVERSNYEGKI